MNNELKSLVIDGEEIFDFISMALNYANVSDLEFRNCDFLNEDILKLINFKQYNRVAFIECTFENETLIKNIRTKSLSLTTSKISNYDFIYEMKCLKNLTIVGGNIDLNKLNNLNNLSYLRISDSYVFNIDKINLEKLNYLFIDGTNIKDISFIENLSNLKLLSISEEQKSNNQKLINKIKNHTKIILDSIIETEVIFDE